VTILRSADQFLLESHQIICMNPVEDLRITMNKATMDPGLIEQNIQIIGRNNWINHVL